MDFVSFFAMSLVLILIYGIISRWVFKVNKHIENQEVIIQLLGQLLLQQGLTVDEVTKILNKKVK